MSRRNLAEETAHRFDLPTDAAAALPRITLTGRKRVSVENHRGLLTYTDECVEFSGGRLRVVIRGTELYLRAMDRHAAVVTGEIICVELL